MYIPTSTEILATVVVTFTMNNKVKRDLTEAQAVITGFYLCLTIYENSVEENHTPLFNVDDVKIERNVSLFFVLHSLIFRFGLSSIIIIFLFFIV